jgi:hypothetical protein
MLASSEARDVNVALLKWPVLLKPFKLHDLVDMLARLPLKKEVLF